MKCQKRDFFGVECIVSATVKETLCGLIRIALSLPFYFNGELPMTTLPGNTHQCPWISLLGMPPHVRV